MFIYFKSMPCIAESCSEQCLSGKHNQYPFNSANQIKTEASFSLQKD